MTERVFDSTAATDTLDMTILASPWPEPGDEFVVVVEVLERNGSLDGFIQDPPPNLAQMLRDYDAGDCVMVEELFGQDFLPESPGRYRMRLRMYVDPAYQIDNNEWSDDEPGLEVLSVERLAAEPVRVPEHSGLTPT